MNSVTTFLVTQVVNVISFLIPALGINPELTDSIDAVMALVLGLIAGAGYFLPLDVLVMCFSAIMVTDNWGIVVRIIKWVISVLPFT